MRGALRVMCGAVGLDDVGLVRVVPPLEGCQGKVAPFEGCHGRVVGSCPGVFVGDLPVNCWMVAIVVVMSRFRVAHGRCSMHRMNSFAT